MMQTFVLRRSPALYALSLSIGGKRSISRSSGFVRDRSQPWTTKSVFVGQWCHFLRRNRGFPLNVNQRLQMAIVSRTAKIFEASG